MTHLLMFRGLARESQHWQDIPEKLRARLPFFKVNPLDLPGFGALYQEACPWRIEDYVDDARSRFLATEPTVKGLVLVGVSLGGMVALHWAMSYPDEVSKVVLVNSSAAGISSLWHRLRPGEWQRLLATVSCVDPVKREEKILALVSNLSPEKRSATTELWRRLARERPVRLSMALQQLWAAAHYTPPKVIPATVRGWVFASRLDRMVDYRASLALVKAYGFSYREHPWAGHDLPSDDPAWFVDQLQTCLMD